MSWTWTSGKLRQDCPAAAPRVPGSATNTLVEPVAPKARKPNNDRLNQSRAKRGYGGAYRDRTDDLLNAIQSLSQLS